ncbi:MAG: hypothetical protein JXB15_07630 [Anaerolineales bacterium]|nr:hypothetical protein [Anaerolineales bacterium]
MNRKTIPLFLLSLLVILALACGSSAPTAAPAAATSTPNNQATIDAAIAATASAQAGMQATIDAAIMATAALAPPTATPGPTVEYVELTEEELEALINQAVNEAVAATTQASTSTTQATSDDAMTSDEVQTVEVYVQGAEQAIAYAEELLEVYYSLYGELATESLAALQEIEQELAYLAESTAAMTAVLVEIENTLSQGLTLAVETINQLENAAQQAVTGLANIQSHTQNWMNLAHKGREDRANHALGLQPDNIPTDLNSSLLSAFDFIDEVRGALGDNKLSRDELNRIAQLGVNAAAGLNQHGGPKLQGFSGKISEITGQLARGQVPHAKRGLGDLEKGLGQRPQRPSGMGGGKRP